MTGQWLVEQLNSGSSHRFMASLDKNQDMGATVLSMKQ